VNFPLFRKRNKREGTGKDTDVSLNRALAAAVPLPPPQPRYTLEIVTDLRTFSGNKPLYLFEAKALAREWVTFGVLLMTDGEPDFHLPAHRIYEIRFVRYTEN